MLKLIFESTILFLACLSSYILKLCHAV